MQPSIHGTRDDAGKQHPVLDIRHWEDQFPLGDDRNALGWIDGPGDVAIREQACRLASTKGTLGPSVPTDVFVWADILLRDRPWLTRIGGRPWRPKGRPWPKDESGIPLTFLGQICFADSKDLLPFEIPGDVALIFGQNRSGWISINEGSALEWSPLRVDEPDDGLEHPWTAALPFEYQGVLHRTRQFTDWDLPREPFKAAGFENAGFQISQIQATSIGTFSSLPQGWPFTEGDGCSLVCTLSSFYFDDEWPLCDVPRVPRSIAPKGHEVDMWNMHALDFGVGDAGCIWVYRTKSGEFKLDSACG